MKEAKRSAVAAATGTSEQVNGSTAHDWDTSTIPSIYGACDGHKSLKFGATVIYAVNGVSGLIDIGVDRHHSSEN